MPDDIIEVLDTLVEAQTVDTPPDIIEVIEPGLRGAAGPPGGTIPFPFSRGTLTAPYVSPFTLRVPYNCIITDVTANVTTSPVGAAILIDLLKTEGSAPAESIYESPSDYITINPGENYVLGSVGTPNPAEFNQGDGLTVKIAQVGTTNPGAFLTLLVSLMRTA